MKTAWLVFLAVVAVPAWGLDAGQASLKRGEELFNSTQLGTSGMSCASCHPGGMKLDEAASYKDEELAATINQCITKPLKGRPLEDGSPELKSLIIYIKSLARAAKTPK